MSIRYLTSFPALDYLPGYLPEESPIIQAEFIEQHASQFMTARFLLGFPSGVG